MKNIKLLFLSSVLLGSGSVWAQMTPQHDHYVKRDSKAVPFYTAYRNWTPGTPLYQADPDAAKDDEFYISRVKPKQRFTNANTQVDPNLNSERKLLWWCPIGTTADDDWNAVPSYFFDSEVFSMWSYVDIYGNWTAPFIRVPGAFTDICHKNGVVTSAVASVPWAAKISPNDGGHGSNFQAMIDGGTDKLLNYLRYYGIDGIGFNSEFYSGSMTEPLKQMLAGAQSKKEEANWPTFHNCWYSLMSNQGGVADYSVLNNGCSDWFDYNGKPTSNAYFLNYNWDGSRLATSQATAQSFPGRSSFEVYAGMDFQGRSKAQWTALKQYDISVGIWGAHDMNMIFEGRGELGSSLLQRQKTYQLISENVFTGASYNPVNTPEITNELGHTTASKTFHGFSSFITARSTMWSDDLAKEPLVTYFNLGNGQFFNIEGQTTFNIPWYNIGIQDYLPTWRWWWTKTFMGRDENQVAVQGMKAEFTWEDAWFGGSCLQISGAAQQEYLHLFKTKYPVQNGDKLLIRYKVESGSGKIDWATSVNDAESTEVNATIGSVSADGVWVEKVVEVGNGRQDLKIADKSLALIALKFTNTTADFKVKIGEISLTRGVAPTPMAPILRSSEMLKRNYKGVDMKIYYKMVEDYPTAEVNPVYNADVDTWYYKVYTQQEGLEPVMCTATTSWAAYVVSAPYDVEKGGKVRIGISAVSMDGNSESEVTWGEYLSVPDATIQEGILIDKPIIKVNETFTISYVDPNHAPAKSWVIQDSKTETTVHSANNLTSITASLPNEGIYNLILTDASGNSETMYGMIQISPKEVGALPLIESLKANDSTDPIEVKAEEEVTFSYVGREADGMVSRGLNMNEKAFGLDANQLNFTSSSDFTVAFWFKVNTFAHSTAGTQLLNIRTTQDTWPASDWGYIWSTIDQNNQLFFAFRKGSANSQTEFTLKDFTFAENQWYHLAYVIDYDRGRKCSVYLNGKRIYTSELVTDLYSWNNTNYILLGGAAAHRAGLNGLLDEFQLYNKALTDDEVTHSMKHLASIPEGLIGYWDFESEPNAENILMSTGTKKDLKAGVYKIVSKSEGRNEFQPQPFAFGTGAPFIPGELFKIETTPEWKLGKAATILTDATGDAQTGSVGVSYDTAGDHTATLTLSNGWGSDSKTFSYVTVGVADGLEDAVSESFKAYPNPFVDEVYIQFAKTGTYEIEVSNMKGQRLATQQATASACEFMKVHINGEAGNYFVTIRENGKMLKTIKIIKK